MRRLFNYFLRGLVLLAPIAVTAYVCVSLFQAVDGLLGLSIPGAGFAITIALITVAGWLASNFLTRSFVALVDRIFTRLPFVRLLYGSTRDLLDAFVGEKRRFDRPVLVELVPGSDAQALGFLTQRSLETLGHADKVAVYLPQSYNVAGQLWVLPATRVQPLSTDSAAVMAFIVSGGVTQVPGTATGLAAMSAPAVPAAT